VRQTVYKHFVAGSTLEECSAVVDKLAAANIKTTLDYSVEAADKVDEVGYLVLLFLFRTLH